MYTVYVHIEYKNKLSPFRDYRAPCWRQREGDPVMSPPPRQGLGAP